MNNDINEFKKYLKHGDVGFIAEKLDVTQDYVRKIMTGLRKTDSPKAAQVKKALDKIILIRKQQQWSLEEALSNNEIE